MKCAIIRDLLPSYVDGLTSEESNQEIEKHLESCEACREYLASMRKEIVSEQYVRDSNQIKEDIKPFKKYKERTVLGTGIVFIIIFVGIVLIIGLLRSPKPLQNILPEFSKETEEYEMFASAAISRIEDGIPYIDMYDMSNISQNSEAYNEIMQIIESTEYRNDLENYLPWETETESKESETAAICTYLVFQDKSGNGFMLLFSDDEVIISENNSDRKDMVYHMTEVQIFIELVEYIKENGILYQ